MQGDVGTACGELSVRYSRDGETCTLTLQVACLLREVVLYVDVEKASIGASY